jgi:multidrug efflux pump subunit AcrB
MASREERKLAGSGSRFVLSGLPLLVIGVVLALVLSGTARGIGVAIALLGAIPIAVGVVLLLSGGVERRSREGKPFA